MLDLIALVRVPRIVYSHRPRLALVFAIASAFWWKMQDGLEAKHASWSDAFTYVLALFLAEVLEIGRAHV